MTAVFLAVVTVLTVAVSACSGDGGTGNDDARQGDTTSTTVDEEAAVLAAYEASWRAFHEASGDPVDPDHPELAETMTGPALTAATRSLGQMAEMGEYLDGPLVELSPEVAELAANRAEIEDCAIDRGQKYAADGSVVARSDSTPFSYRAVMVKEAGVWKNSELSRGDPCEP